MRLLSESDIREGLTPWAAIEANRVAFLALHKEIAAVPKRIILPTPNNSVTLFKPCDLPPQSEAQGSTTQPLAVEDVGLDAGGLGLKVISVRPENSPPLSTTPAVVMLFNRQDGTPLAILNASYLTALRTAAGSALATDLLVEKNKEIEVTIFGAGLQAECHVLTLCCVRKVKKVVIVNRNRGRAEALIQKLKSCAIWNKRKDPLHVPKFEIILNDDKAGVELAVREADVLCTTTASPTALFDGSWLKPGAHVNAVGSYQSHTRELDDTTVARSRIVVDTMDALNAGEFAIPVESMKFNIALHQLTSLGELLESNGKANSSLPAGEKDTMIDKLDVTLFKSVGCAVQDIATACAALKGCKSCSKFDIMA